MKSTRNCPACRKPYDEDFVQANLKKNAERLNRERSRERSRGPRSRTRGRVRLRRPRRSRPYGPYYSHSGHRGRSRSRGIYPRGGYGYDRGSFVHPYYPSYTIDPRIAELSDKRVIQHTLLYVVGLTAPLSKELSFLRENFGRYGEIVKLVINAAKERKDKIHKDPTVSAYITYDKEEDCKRAIDAIDGTCVDGKMLRAGFGTTKYCQFFLQRKECTKQDCMYLHKINFGENVYNRDEIILVGGLPLPKETASQHRIKTNIEKHIWFYKGKTSSMEIYNMRKSINDWDAPVKDPVPHSYERYDGSSKFNIAPEEERPKKIISKKKKKSQRHLPQSSCWAQPDAGKKTKNKKKKKTISVLQKKKGNKKKPPQVKSIKAIAKKTKEEQQEMRKKKMSTEQNNAKHFQQQKTKHLQQQKVIQLQQQKSKQLQQQKARNVQLKKRQKQRSPSRVRVKPPSPVKMIIAPKDSVPTRKILIHPLQKITPQQAAHNRQYSERQIIQRPASNSTPQQVIQRPSIPVQQQTDPRGQNMLQKQSLHPEVAKRGSQPRNSSERKPIINPFTRKLPEVAAKYEMINDIRAQERKNKEDENQSKALLPRRPGPIDPNYFRKTIGSKHWPGWKGSNFDDDLLTVPKKRIPKVIPPGHEFWFKDDDEDTFDFLSSSKVGTSCFNYSVNVREPRFCDRDVDAEDFDCVLIEVNSHLISDKNKFKYDEDEDEEPMEEFDLAPEFVRQFDESINSDDEREKAKEEAKKETKTETKEESSEKIINFQQSGDDSYNFRYETKVNPETDSNDESGDNDNDDEESDHAEGDRREESSDSSDQVDNDGSPSNQVNSRVVPQAHIVEESDESNEHETNQAEKRVAPPVRIIEESDNISSESETTRESESESENDEENKVQNDERKNKEIKKENNKKNVPKPRLRVSRPIRSNPPNDGHRTGYITGSDRHRTGYRTGSDRPYFDSDSFDYKSYEKEKYDETWREIGDYDESKRSRYDYDRGRIFGRGYRVGRGRSYTPSPYGHGYDRGRGRSYGHRGYRSFRGHGHGGYTHTYDGYRQGGGYVSRGYTPFIRRNEKDMDRIDREKRLKYGVRK